MNPQRRPNLFIIGAMKSGTSSLHAYLGAHPSVFMCEPKEPCYFVDRVDLNRYVENLGLWRGEDRYLALFNEAGAATIVGESSTAYAKAPRIKGVADRIARFNPDARFIYLMRDPVERTVSHYWHMVRHYGEHRSLERAIRETAEYCDVSDYAMQLRQYYDVFHADQVLPLTFEDLVGDAVSVVKRICDWLGVDASFVPPSLTNRENVTTPEVTQVKGWGLLGRFRHSRLWSAVGGGVPHFVRDMGRRLSERTVARNSRFPAGAIDFLRSIQLAQTETLRDLLHRDFPEWTTLYGDGAESQQVGIASAADGNRPPPKLDESCRLPH